MAGGPLHDDGKWLSINEVNQLTTNKLTIEASDTPEEIGQRLSEFFNFHEEFTEQEKRRIYI